MEPKISGYVNANAGFLTNASHDVIFMASPGLGVKVEKNGFYAQSEAGYGTSMYAKAEVGKDFSFGDNNWGINTSIGGQYTIKNRERDYYGNKYKDGGNSPTWKPKDTRGYANVAFTYNTPVFKASLGARAGVKTSSQPSLDGITLEKVGQIIGTEHAGKSTKKYIVPRLEFEAGGKSTFNLSVSPDELQIGGKLYF